MKKLKAMILAALFLLTAFGGVPVVYAEEAQGVQLKIDSAAAGAVIALEADCNESLTVAADRDVTLDLAGHTIGATVTNAGTLKLIDSVGTGKIAVSVASGTATAVSNSGSLTIDGATLDCSASGSAVVHALANESGATLTVKSGAVTGTATGSGFAFGINNKAGATIASVAGGTVTARVTDPASAGNAIAINNLGSITAITGGELNAEAFGTSKETTAIRSNGRIERISGGSLRGYVKNGGALSFGLFNQASGTIGEIAGGEIVGETDANDYAFGLRNLGVVDAISGGVICVKLNSTTTTLSPNAVAVCNDKTIGSITGGTFYAHSVTAKGGTIGIRTRGAGSTVGSMTGGAIRLSKPSDGNYIFNEGGGVTTLGQGFALSAAQGSGYRYVLGEGQTVTEAFEDGDALMTGSVKESGQTVKTYVLAGVLKNDAASVGEYWYASIDEAIAAAQANATVTVQKDLDGGFTVGADKNVTVDLNGHTVSGTATNRGTLKLIDGAGTGRLFKATTAAGRDPLVYNYGTLDYCVDGLICGNGNTTEAHGVYNEAGATITVRGGVLRAVSYGSCFGHGITGGGAVVVEGGAVEAISLNADTAANIVAVALTGSGRATIDGGRLYALNYGKAGSAIGARAQGSSEIVVNGGEIKAIVNSATDGSAACYGVYVEGTNAAAALHGGNVSAISYSDFAFGLFNKGSLDLDGGCVSAAVAHELADKAPNAIALSNEGAATVGGGYLRAENGHEGGGAYGVRNRGNLTVSGGVFAFTAANGAYVLDPDEKTTYNDGVTLMSMTAENVGYAAAEGDVIVEQLDGQTFIGADVFRGGQPLYAVHTYGASDRIVGFETAEGIEVRDFETIEQSTTVYANIEAAPVYYFLGSSVTYGHANNGSSFVNVIADRLDCVCVKEAVSGTTLAERDSNSYVSRMRRNLDRNQKVDRLIVQLSTNDASQNVPRGTIAESKNIEDFDTTTTLGAIEYIIAYAKAVWGCEVTFYTNPPYNNASYKSLVDDIYKVQQKWGIDVLDFYNYKDMPPLSSTTLAGFMADDIHPNAQGYRWMGEVFADYLQNA